MMIKCPECGKDISDKAKACPDCGCVIKEFGKKKESVLSTIACLLAVFTFTCYLSIPVALIDLLRKDKDHKKHTGSKFAIVWSIFVIIILNINK